MGDLPELVHIGGADAVEPAVDRRNGHAQVTGQLPTLHAADGKQVFQAVVKFIFHESLSFLSVLVVKFQLIVDVFAAIIIQQDSGVI